MFTFHYCSVHSFAADKVNGLCLSLMLVAPALRLIPPFSTVLKVLINGRKQIKGMVVYYSCRACGTEQPYNFVIRINPQKRGASKSCPKHECCRNITVKREVVSFRLGLIYYNLNFVSFQFSCIPYHFISDTFPYRFALPKLLKIRKFRFESGLKHEFRRMISVVILSIQVLDRFGAVLLSATEMIIYRLLFHL